MLAVAPTEARQLCDCSQPSHFKDLRADIALHAQIQELGLAPDNAVPGFSLVADGTQNYVCVAGDGKWTLETPSAALYRSHADREEQRDPVCTHYFAEKDAAGGQATWESNADGSSVTVALNPAAAGGGRVDAPNGGATIPWLSTLATSHVAGPVFGSVVAVVRAETSGGVEPDAALCDRKGRQIFVPYLATYFYYV